MEVINELKSKYGPHILINKLPPSQIGFLLREVDTEVIFVSKAVRPSVTRQSRVDNYDESSSLDITGQPLEPPSSQFDHMNFSNSTLMYEESELNSIFPMSVTDARDILSHCNLHLKPPCPVYIVTDARDFQNTLILANDLSDGWMGRSWVTSQSLNSFPDFEQLKAEHAQFSQTNIYAATCEASCKYTIAKEMNYDQLYRSATLHISWVQKSFEPPLHDMSTQVKFDGRIRAGQASSGVLKVLWEQIKLVHEYIQLRTNIMNQTYASTDSPLPSPSLLLECYDKEPTNEDMSERLRKVLHEAGRRGIALQGCISSRQQQDVNSIMNLNITKEHPESDVTDLLWLLLIECKSIKDLITCLRTFLEQFNELMKHNLPPPYVNPKNISRLGQVLLGPGGISHSLSYNNPIEYLIEIGLEKIKKELILIFSHIQLSGSFNLNLPDVPNFSELSATDWLSSAQEWHLWLTQGYSSIEMLWNIETSLSLSNKELYSMMRDVLERFIGKSSNIKSFEELVNNPLLKFESSLPIKNVDKVIRGKEKEEFIITFSTDYPKRKFKSTYYLTPENLFPNVTSLCDDETSKLNITSCQLYFLYVHRFISELFHSKR